MADEYLDIDLDSLRIREIEEFEELTDTAFDDAFKPGHPKAKSLRAIGFLIKKRDDPNYTWEAAGELILKLAAPDPTPAAG